jgi:hypothetical protein
MSSGDTSTARRRDKKSVTKRQPGQTGGPFVVARIAEKTGDGGRPRNGPAIPVQEGVFVLDGLDRDTTTSRTAAIAAFQSGARHHIGPVIGGRNSITGCECEDPRGFINRDSGRACDSELAHP